jgi:hypothetical protein
MRSPAQPVQVPLPGGLWQKDEDSALMREVHLRPVADADRAFLLQTLDEFAPAQRATALLARCLTDECRAETLTVGDREALLLHLHRLTFGEAMDCVLRCPGAKCGRQMELTPRVADLLVAQYEAPQRSYEAVIPSAESAYRVHFRLPVAGDLDAITATAATDLDQAALLLMQRCVSAATRDGVAVGMEAMPTDICDAVAAQMARHDPQAEIELDLNCPSCGLNFSVVLDAASFLLQELDARATQMLRDVHVLASQYGWSESDILSMPASRRTRYLELIAAGQARTSNT